MGLFWCLKKAEKEKGKVSKRLRKYRGQETDLRKMCFKQNAK